MQGSSRISRSCRAFSRAVSSSSGALSFCPYLVAPIILFWRYSVSGILWWYNKLYSEYFDEFQLCELVQWPLHAQPHLKWVLGWPERWRHAWTHHKSPDYGRKLLVFLNAGVISFSDRIQYMMKKIRPRHTAWTHNRWTGDWCEVKGMGGRPETRWPQEQTCSTTIDECILGAVWSLNNSKNVMFLGGNI